MPPTESPADSPPPAQTLALDYAQRPRRRKKWLRRIGFVLLLAGLVMAVNRWVPPAINQLQLLYCQQQCMDYSSPADRVVYEESRDAAYRLIASDPNYLIYSGSRSQELAAEYMAPLAARFNQLACPVSAGNINLESATAFMHERISPAGHRRLVYVSFHASEWGWAIRRFSSQYDYASVALDPATLRQPPVQHLFHGYTIDAIGPRDVPVPHIRVYAGQCDPNDASHFTIRYEMWGQSDTLDGWLDDASNVTITPRNPPKEPK